MSHPYLIKSLQCLTAVGALALMGSAYAAPLSCPEVSTIKAVSIQFSAEEEGWKGEQFIDNKSMVKGFKFMGSAIKQGTDSETNSSYYYVTCDYSGKGKDDYLRLSQRFILPPGAKGPGWNRDKNKCETSKVADCAFELENSKGPAQMKLPAQ
jgi:hypothetical protein